MFGSKTKAERKALEQTEIVAVPLEQHPEVAAALAECSRRDAELAQLRADLAAAEALKSDPKWVLDRSQEEVEDLLRRIESYKIRATALQNAIAEMREGESGIVSMAKASAVAKIGATVRPEFRKRLKRLLDALDACRAANNELEDYKRRAAVASGGDHYVIPAYGLDPQFAASFAHHHAIGVDCWGTFIAGGQEE
jgi:chromosome segregation ATPase